MKVGSKEREHYKAVLLRELTQHVGAHRRIGMGELYQRVFGRPWSHRINDTRDLRTLITELRYEGVPIVSVSDRHGGGYYLASAGSETEEYCARLRVQALKKLKMEARIRRIALPRLVGQIAMNLGDDDR